MYAQRMLESTDLPMDQVALRSGFGSLVAMRGHFRRHLSTSPTAYRQTFRGHLTETEADHERDQDRDRAQDRDRDSTLDRNLDRNNEHGSRISFTTRDGA